MSLRAWDSVVMVLSVTHQSFTSFAAFVCFMQTKSLETKDFNELLVEKSPFLCAIYLSGAASSQHPPQQWWYVWARCPLILALSHACPG